MRRLAWAIVLGLTTAGLLSSNAALAQDPAGNDWIFVADKLSLLQKYVEGSDVGRNMKDRNLRARLTSFDTAAVLLPPSKTAALFEVRINVRKSTRLETLAIPKEDYEALVKFASETALQQPGEAPVPRR